MNPMEALLKLAGWVEVGGGDDHVAWAHPDTPTFLVLLFDDGRWEYCPETEEATASGSGVTSLLSLLHSEWQDG